MTKNRAAVLSALFLLAGSAAAWAQAPSSFKAATAEQVSIEITSEPGTYETPSPDAGAGLIAEAACSVTRPSRIDMSLHVTGDVAGRLRVDITGYNDGFATGRFVTSGARSGRISALAFLDAEPGVYYYWRLLGGASDNWVVRAHGRFEAPTCPVDHLPE